MVVAGGRHQEQLGRRQPALGRTLDQEAADSLRTGRAAGLAGADDLQPARLKPEREALELGGLARTLAAFEGDEVPAAGGRRLSRHRRPGS